MDGPNPVNKLLACGALADLVSRAQDRTVLGAAIMSRLPDDLRPHISFAALEDGELTLVANSPVWASKARFQVAEIQQAVTDPRRPVHNVRIRTAAAAARYAPETAPQSAREVQPLSPQVRELLKATAAALPAGPIKSALCRLGEADR